MTIAFVLLKKKEYSISFDILKQIVYHYQDKSNLNRSEMLLLSWVNTLLAQIHKQTNYPDLAINEFRKACEWGIKARNIEYTRSAYIYLALTYEEIGKEYIAIEIAEELLEQIEKNFEKDEFSLSSAYNLLGNIFGRLGEFEVAKNNYFKAYNAVTNTILLQRIKSFYLNNLGVIAFKMGNYEEALTYYLQSLELAIQKENPRELSYYYSNIGEVYLSLNQPENALKSELNALNYLNTYQNDDLLIETYFLLIKTYLTQQDTQRAEFYLKELGKLTSSSRKLSYTIKFKIAEALLLKEKHKTILAKEIFLQVLSYFNLTYDSKILALTELAEMVLSEKIEIQREDFEDLEKISQKLLYLAKEKDSPPVISNVSIFLSQILLIGSDYDNAIKLLTETKNYCTVKNALFFRDKIQHELKNIYELKHIDQENNINKQSINNYNSEEILNNIRELQRFMLAFAK